MFVNRDGVKQHARPRGYVSARIAIYVDRRHVFRVMLQPSTTVIWNILFSLPPSPSPFDVARYSSSSFCHIRGERQTTPSKLISHGPRSLLTSRVSRLGRQCPPLFLDGQSIFSFALIQSCLVILDGVHRVCTCASKERTEPHRLIKNTRSNQPQPTGLRTYQQPNSYGGLPFHTIITMPATNRTPHPTSRRDSWPPTQVSLYRKVKADDDTKMHVGLDESLIDDDPINSFLSPTPLLDDGDTDDEMDLDLEMDMAFDAGIVDSSRPMPIIRSISPSKLGGGLRSPPPRTPTPPHLRFGPHSPPSRNSPEVSTPTMDIGFDDYDDGEDYVRLSPLPPGSLSLAVPAFNLGSSKSLGKSRKAKSAAVAAAKAEEKEEDRVALMMARGSAYTDEDEYFTGSPSFHVGRPKMAQAPRGRPTRPALPRLPARPKSWSGASGYGSGRLSPRAWREPSPDVWSIEEEDEAEISDMDLDTHEHETKSVTKRDKGKGKKVRFALPVREEIP